MSSFKQMNLVRLARMLLRRERVLSMSSVIISKVTWWVGGWVGGWVGVLGGLEEGERGLKGRVDE